MLSDWYNEEDMFSDYLPPPERVLSSTLRHAIATLIFLDGALSVRGVEVIMKPLELYHNGTRRRSG